MVHNNSPMTMTSLSKRKNMLSGWTTMITGDTREDKIEEDKVKICITTGQPAQVKKTISIQPQMGQMSGTMKFMIMITMIQT